MYDLSRKGILMGKLLNCNNVGGNLITERTAITTFFGKKCSIEDMYLNARRDENGDIANDKPLHHLLINGVEMPVKDGGSFYELLWYQFLAENKDIYEKIMTYEEFDDGKDNVMNSTARVFRLLKKGGLNGLKSNCKEFLNRFNEKRMASNSLNSVKPNIDTNKADESNNTCLKEDFSSLDTYAKKIVNKYKNSNLYKQELIDVAVEEYNVSDKNLTVFKRLVALRYDEFVEVSSDIFIKSVLNGIREDYNKINDIDEGV